MNLGIYIRLSKEDLNNNKTIESQRNIIYQYLENLTINKLYEYIDNGYSGTTFDRPNFNRMINDIKNNKIDTVITKDTSRLGRNMTWTTYYIEEFFPNHNIRYISINDNYDSIKKDNNELYTFKNLFNEYYCKDISKKIRTSLIAKKKLGLFLGWKAPYGYKKSNSNKYKIEVDEKVRNIIERIFNLALNNNPNQIANILNKEKILSPSAYFSNSNSKWTSKTIKDILSNEVYIGNLIQCKKRKINYKLKKVIKLNRDENIIIEDNHEAIIDKELFMKVNNNINIKNKKRNKLYLENLLFCHECGSKLNIYKSNNNYYTVCSNYKNKRNCFPHTNNYLKIEKNIISQLNYRYKEIIKKEIHKKSPNEKLRLLINKKHLLENNILNDKDIIDNKKELDDVINQIKKYLNIRKIDINKLYLYIIEKIEISNEKEIYIYMNL